MITKGFVAKPILVIRYVKAAFLFEASDLTRVFERIAEVWSLAVIESGKTAIVMLPSFEDLFKAFDLLHGREIVSHQTRDQIVLSLLEDSPAGQGLLEQAKNAGKSTETTTEPKQPDNSKGEQKTSVQKAAAAQQPKLTCKYEIDPFDEDASRDFLLSKRIIGPKGSNMKKIIEECFKDRPFEADALKLRLRGKGSGFKEGPLNKGRCS